MHSCPFLSGHMMGCVQIEGREAPWEPPSPLLTKVQPGIYILVYRVSFPDPTGSVVWE